MSATMRALFMLDDVHVNAAEHVLLNHGGAGALDHEDAMEQTATA